MTNELLDAAKNSSDDSSEERYEKIKQQEAGTSQSKAEKRYEKLKEKAKQEFIDEQRHKEQDEQEENQDEENESEKDNDGFVTY